MLKYYITPIFLFVIIQALNAKGIFYQDRVLFYVDNEILDFEIRNNQKTTSLKNLNDILKGEKVLKVEKWLPMARSTDRNKDIYLSRYFIIYLDQNHENINKLVNNVLSLKEITSCEKMPIVSPAFIPNDELWDQLYGLPQVKAHLAYDLWDIEGGEIPGQMESGEIIVAIPDIGLMWDHPDLINNVWQNSGEDIDGDGRVIELINNHWVFDPDDVNGVDDDDDGYVDNFVGYDPAFGDNDPYPVNSYHQHGTKVAGNVAASTNNGIGLASVGYSVKIMGVNANGNVDEPWFLTHTSQAVLASAQMGADIINCSWVSGYSEAQNNLFQTVYNEYGCITLGAAGNGENNGGPSDTTDFDPRYPAAFDNVISVTAMSPNDNFNCWANAHETVDLSAPGEAIICAMPFDIVNPEQYAIGNGTSYATPMTAGAVALVKSVIPNASNETIISKIVGTTDYFSDMTKVCNGQSVEGMLGSGQLNIYRAILATREPELLVTNIEIQTPDGLVHPGDTVMINFSVGNTPVFLDADNVTIQMVSDDTNINMLDGLITYETTFASGFETQEQFTVNVSEDATLGNIYCNILISATCEGSEYSNNFPLHIPVNYGQYGYPIQNVNIHHSATIADLDDNALSEIYFSSDSQMYATWVAGFDVTGFPFNADSEISTASAIGDINGDGTKELVFGTVGGMLYAITNSADEHLTYLQPDTIRDSPALADLDMDGTLEIIFISGNSTSSILNVINNEGEDYNGFPIDITDKIVSGPAVADLDNDSSVEIVLTTTEGQLLVVDGNGNFKDGFPFETLGSLKYPATLGDLDGDNDLEVIAANENGDLFVVHHDGSLMLHHTYQGFTLSSISLADLDNNGQIDLLFMSSENDQPNHSMLHVFDPSNQSELLGWPISINAMSKGEIIVSDIDNDGELEILITDLSGRVHIYNNNGLSYVNFPFIGEDSIQSTLSIGDLDNDNDFELIFGTSKNLEVIDIQDEKGSRYSWNMFRANLHRTGYFNSALATVDVQDSYYPKYYSLSDNFPNPFNPSTTINYNLSEKGFVDFSIYDIVGRKVVTLVNDIKTHGSHSITWDGLNENGSKLVQGCTFINLRLEILK